MRVLIADDDRMSTVMLARTLERWGFETVVAHDGAAAWERIAGDEPPALAIIDWMMPRVDGIELCRRIRATPPRSPVYVILLTARTSRQDLVAGLEAGADDYVVKPFVLREVAARIKALARRAQGTSQRQKLQIGDLSYDTATFEVLRAGTPITLPPIPLRLLEVLMRASPRVMSRDDLVRAVWGDAPPDSDALRAHLHLLRNAVDKPFARPLIRTLRGLGWQIAAADAPPP